MPEIVFLDKQVAVIVKPQGMPSQRDSGGDLDAMSATSLKLKEMGEPSDLWLVHRLDRTVGGLIVFARTKSAASRLSSLVSEGGMRKNYLAVCRGVCDGGEYRDFIYKDPVLNKAFVAKSRRAGVKEAVLICHPLDVKEQDNKSLSLCNIELITGRFHQIRVQLSSRRHPIVGDRKYGGNDVKTKFPALFSTFLGFTLGDKEYRVEAKPDMSAYPWNLFLEESL